MHLTQGASLRGGKCVRSVVTLVHTELEQTLKRLVCPSLALSLMSPIPSRERLNAWGLRILREARHPRVHAISWVGSPTGTSTCEPFAVVRQLGAVGGILQLLGLQQRRNSRLDVVHVH